VSLSIGCLHGARHRKQIAALVGLAPYDFHEADHRHRRLLSARHN
jgi:hypothetical protein